MGASRDNFEFLNGLSVLCFVKTDLVVKFCASGNNQIYEKIKMCLLELTVVRPGYSADL